MEERKVPAPNERSRTVILRDDEEEEEDWVAAAHEELRIAK